MVYEHANEELLSDCCGAPKHGDWEICGECLEHCEFELSEE